MNITNKTLCRILFIITIGIFFFLKLEVCSLPYYWDELGVYSQAALYMYDHTPSLLPGDLPDVLSRGHPLLFMFIYACYFKVFGTSIMGVHIFTCLISISFVGISYRLAERFFSPVIALWSSILLMVQPLFFAQAVFVLPEIMLGVFALLSVYFYLNKKIGYSSIFASLALLTKETGIVLPIVFLIMEGILFFRKEINFKQLVGRLLVIFLPYYTFGLFIIIQRIQNGWFFYPYHTGFISLDPESIYWRLIGYLNFVFTKQGRITWLILVILSIPLAIFVYKIQFKKLIATLWEKFSEKTFTAVTFIFYALGILGYSALNYPLQRYILLIYPVFTIFIVLIIFYLAQKRILITCFIMLVFGIVNLFFMKSSKKMVENDMAYVDLLKIQIEICHYFDTPELKTKKLAIDFPIQTGFFDPRLGYVTQSGFTLQNTPDEFDPAVDYYVYTNPGNMEEKEIIGHKKLALLKEFHEGAAEGYIYQTLK